MCWFKKGNLNRSGKKISPCPTCCLDLNSTGGRGGLGAKYFWFRGSGGSEFSQPLLERLNFLHTNQWQSPLGCRHPGSDAAGFPAQPKAGRGSAPGEGRWVRCCVFVSWNNVIFDFYIHLPPQLLGFFQGIEGRERELNLLLGGWSCSCWKSLACRSDPLY